jgi:DNA-binding response OmpR family regulator
MNPESKTLLVVDDDPALRESLEELLHQQGYRVLTAADGEEALRLVREKRPDLVVLDVVLPAMDGFRVATLVKSDPALQRIPIILYSGRLEESFAILAYETKAEYFLPKGGNGRPILEAIRQLLERTP